MIADYAEMVCWRESTVSDTTIIRSLERLDENDHMNGVQEESDIENCVGSAFVEIGQRIRACGDGYPFCMDGCGHSLRRRDTAENRKGLVYFYLLLATRLNMKKSRNHANIDGTQLFEELSAAVAEKYFGARAESYIFGTATKGSFVNKVDELCQRIGEGKGFREQKTDPLEKDGGLDVVVWKHFRDRTPGKLMAFGQCKTGTSYADQLSEMYPDKFCEKWMIDTPVVWPIRMYFVAEALSRRGNWRNTVLDAGLLFDRCRIIDYCNGLSENLYQQMSRWTAVAAEDNELPANAFD